MLKSLAARKIDLLSMKTEELFDYMDKDLKEHSLRVADLSLKIAKVIDEPINEIALYKAALYHDIGKLAIDNTILNKPAKLTVDEMKIVKLHAKYSAQILSTNIEHSDVIMGSLLHHENFDGTGYPFGYHGKDIPIIARIIRVADTFDALHSKRAYKDALIIDQCIDIMNQTRSHYDSKILDILVKKIL